MAKVGRAGGRATPTVAVAEAGGAAEALVDGRSGLLADDEAHFIELTRQLLDIGQVQERDAGRGRHRR